jgi:PadR family transcriptional regulator, regulatory protein PadR
MNLDNIKQQMRKGVLELCILSILSKGDAYPSEIIIKMKDAQLLVVEGTLYPLLTRLKNEGMLSYNWVESSAGPPRKYYRLTAEGEKIFSEMKLAWVDLNNSINKILNNL